MTEKLKTVSTLAAVFVAAVLVLSFSGQAMNDRPTRAEVQSIADKSAKTVAPYVADKEKIEQQFRTSHELMKRTHVLLEENAKAMQSLAEALNRLSSSSE